MKRAIAFLAFTLASCGTSDEESVKEALRPLARDPDSIIVRNLHDGTPAAHTDPANKRIICGEWNSKNGFGGMGTWSRFAVFKPSNHVSYEGSPEDEGVPSRQEITSQVLNDLCGV